MTFGLQKSPPDLQKPHFLDLIFPQGLCFPFLFFFRKCKSVWYTQYFCEVRFYDVLMFFMFFHVLSFRRRHRAEAKKQENATQKHERNIVNIHSCFLFFSGPAGSAQKVGPERRKSHQNGSIFDPQTLRKSSQEPEKLRRSCLQVSKVKLDRS